MDDLKADATRLIIGQIESGLEVYNVKKGSYPKSLQDAAEVHEDQKVPVDAWNNDFEYSPLLHAEKATKPIKDGKKVAMTQTQTSAICGEGRKTACAATEV